MKEYQRMKSIRQWPIGRSIEIHQRTSKNEANTSMYHWTINQLTWKDIKEWSQHANELLDHQSKCMKEHKKIKPIIEWPIGRSIELHERTSKNEANTLMYHWTINQVTWKDIKEWSQPANELLDHQSKCLKEHQKIKPIIQWPIGRSIEIHEKTSKNEANTSMYHWTIN